MITAVDTNIILDILVPGSEHSMSSLELLEGCQRGGRAVVCEVVYMELLTQFSNAGECDTFLHEVGLDLDNTNRNTWQKASAMWAAYRGRSGDSFHCPQCDNLIVCSKCGISLRRRHILADFVIGAHALCQADQLLTRDRGFHRKWFSALAIVS